MDTLISNVTAVTMNPRMEVLFGAYIGITEGKISYIGKTAPQDAPATIVDGTGMVAMPGLVNCHTHLATAALRGCFEDLSPREALDFLLKKEAKMDLRCAKAAATLAISECLRFGITSVSDLSGFALATAQAAAESGIKANIAMSCCYFPGEEEFSLAAQPQCRELLEAVEAWHGHDGGRIRVDCGILGEYASDYPLWEALGVYGAEQGLGLQLHLSQTRQEVDSCLDRSGLTPPQLLDCHELFRLPTCAAGGGCLEPEDLALLGRRKASLVALPLESARRGEPWQSVTPAVKAGMNVALGTGGTADCGSLDLFEAMRALACRERIALGGPEAMPSPALLTMATVCGAAAQGRSQETGMLSVGMDADIILVDFSAPHLVPCHNVLSALVFSAKGGDVALTMVRGRILYQNGQFPTLDVAGALEELTQYAIPHLFSQEA